MAGFALLSLQENDSAIDRLISRRTALESGDALSGVREEADSAERGFGELKLRLDVMARDQQRFEHEIDSITAEGSAEEQAACSTAASRTSRSSRRSSTRSTNLKKRRSDREDELLALLEQKEELEYSAAGRRGESTKNCVPSSTRRQRRPAWSSSRCASELERTAGGPRWGSPPSLTPSCWSSTRTCVALKKGVGRPRRSSTACVRAATSNSPSVELDQLKRADGHQEV